MVIKKMDQILSELKVKTDGQGFINITHTINKWIKDKKLKTGILSLSTKHTSCSLTINENADPKVLEDLACYMSALVPEIGFKGLSGEEGLNTYQHNQEGPDDMPAHIKTMLTNSVLSLSIYQEELVLGIWQAIYLWEHRSCPQWRTICLHAIGELNKDN